MAALHALEMIRLKPDGEVWNDGSSIEDDSCLLLVEVGWSYE